MQTISTALFSLSIICACLFIVSSFKRRHLAVARPIVGFGINLCIINIMLLTMVLSTSLAVQQFASDVVILSLSLQMPLWVWLFFEYHYERQINHPALLLALIDPAFVVVAYFWGLDFLPDHATEITPPDIRIGNYEPYHLAYLLGVCGALIISSAWALLRKRRHSFGAIAFFGTAIVIPPTLSYLFAIGVMEVRLSGPFLTFLFFLGTLRFGLLEVMPVAFSNVIDNLKSGVIVFNTRWELLYANQTAWDAFNIQRESENDLRPLELPANQLRELFNTQTLATQKRSIFVDKRGQVFRQNFEQPFLDQQCYEAQLEPLLNKQNKQLGFSLLLYDITQQAQAAALLQQQKEQLSLFNKQKSDFFAGISHEFRTPLTLSLGYLNAIKDGQHGHKLDSLQTPLKIAKDNNERLLTLVNQLLELSRLDASSLSIKPQKLNIHQRLKSLLNSFDGALSSQGIKLNWTLESEDMFVYVDYQSFDKVVINLVSNALKAMPQGGTLNISTNKLGSVETALCISDTGRGIDADILPTIFEPFVYREHQSANWPQGVGVGLSLVKQLLDLHQAQISVVSQAGQGAAFSIRFKAGFEHFDAGLDIDHNNLEQTVNIPIAVTKDNTVNKLALPTAHDGSKHQLLLVEDNADMRAFIRTQLTPHFHVIEAGDGQHGLELCKTKLPDLVLSDIMMPIMDGVTMCEKIKTDQSTSHIPVLLLTAKSGEENKLKGLAHGANDYLLKPFNTQELILRLNNLMHTQTQQKKFYAKWFKHSELLDLNLPKTETSFLEALKIYIADRLHESDLKVADLASQVNMSERSLNRKLKALTGQSPKQLLLEIRLAHASKLLRNTDKPIAYISDISGFVDASYFARLFKTHYQQTPKAHRLSAKQA